MQPMRRGLNHLAQLLFLYSCLLLALLLAILLVLLFALLLVLLQPCTKPVLEIQPFPTTLYTSIFYSTSFNEEREEEYTQERENILY